MADFIGEVTIIDGTARKVDEGYEVEFAEGQPALYCKTDMQLANGQSCHIAIRPEKISISAEKPTDRRNVLRGKVHDIAYLGNISTYHVELPTGKIIKAQTANTRRLANRPFTWEDEVWLSWSDTAGVLLER